MQWLFLLVCLLALAPDLPPGLISDRWHSAVGTWAGVAVIALAGFLLGRAFANRQCPSLDRSHVRLYRILRLTLGVGTVLNQALALIVFDWGNVVRVQYGLRDTFLADELLILAPLIIGLTAFWWGIYPAEKSLREEFAQTTRGSFWSRPGYVLFQMRVNFGLLLLPLMLYIALQELGTGLSFPHLVISEGHGQWLLLGLSIASALGTLAILPWALVRVWGTRSLPAGPVRELLETTAHRFGFRCTDFRVWHTRHNVANALVTGIFPWPRYIIFSDALLDELSREELVAALGHEIGHVRRRHMLLYVLFLALALLSGGLLICRFTYFQDLDFLVLSFRLPSGQFGWRHWLELIGLFACLGAYIWLIFGFVSRRCEREADIYGCLAASCNDENCDGHHDWTSCLQTKPTRLCPAGIHVFTSTLEKVAQLNGISKRHWSWRHGSIAQRIAYLERLKQELAQQREVPRLSWVPHWGLLGVLAVITLVLYFA